MSTEHHFCFLALLLSWAAVAAAAEPSPLKNVDVFVSGEDGSAGGDRSRILRTGPRARSARR